MRTLPAAALLLPLCLPTPAHAAEEPRTSGPVVGLRMGAALPVGRFSNETGEPGLERTYAAALPVALEAGYRFGPRLSAGVLLQLAHVRGAKDACANNAGCDGTLTRAALYATLHLPPLLMADPWVGVTAGYTWTQHGVAVVGAQAQLRYAGPELFGLQLGTDFWVGNGLQLGPYLSTSVGSFTRVEARLGGSTAAEDLRYPGLHLWVGAGVRGQFAFFERETLPPEVANREQETGALAVLRYDAALAELRQLDWLLERGHTSLARAKLERALTATSEALAWLEDPLLAGARPSHYVSSTEGRMPAAQLLERLQQLRTRSQQQLEALGPASP